VTSANPAGLDLVGLDRWMAEHVDEWVPGAPMTTTLLADGRSNVSYRLEQRGNVWVLRRPPLGHVMESAHDMSREHTVLSGLARAGFPAPKPTALCDDETVIGAPFLIMEFVDARVVSSAEDAVSLTASEADAISGALVSTLVQLHDLDVASAGLQGLGRPQGYFERQVRRWTAQWSTTQSAPVADVDALAEWLAARVDSLPTATPWSLVHGDFRLDNVMLERAAPRVAAVLDWEMSTLGDPIADLAITLVYWSRPGDTLRHAVPVAGGVTDVDGFWERDRIVDAYARESGRDLEQLDLCVVLACFKLAVIMESIHFRTVAGHQLGAAAQDGTDMHAAAVALAAMGMEVASGAGLSGLSA
jgi:aminoglycoside phosphotransferase (APT) family kinase protein